MEFFSCDEHPVFGVHLLGSLFGIMQLALPECVAGIFVSLLLQAASHILLLSHFSPFPIHRSYALVCSCVDVDVKLTDTHWACPLGSNKIRYPSAPYLATGSNDDTAKLWLLNADCSAATCVATLQDHSDSVTSVAFHPSAPYLATGSSDRTAKLWR